MNHSGPTSSQTARPGASGEADLAVLLVDATSTADRHATGLEHEFVRVITAETVEGALERLSTTDIDCVISEYELPDGDGIQLLETVRMDYPALPFIIWTDSGDETVASRAIAAGVTDYVPKRPSSSSDYGDLADRIRTTLAKGREPTERGDRDGTLKFVSDTCRELTEADTVADGFHAVLETVCEYTNWDYGEVWVRNEEQSQLTCAASYAKDDRFDAFTEVTTSMIFRPDEGLPGRVWSSGTPERISDITTVSAHRYLRTASAETVDLETAFGVPVRGDAAVEAVVVVYSTDQPTADSGTWRVVKAVTAILGTYVTQHRSERAESSKRDRALEERTKELATIHRAAALCSTDECPIDDLLQEIVDLLPLGFRYPETTVARITCGPYGAATDGFEARNHTLTIRGETQDGTAIALEVGYLEEHPPKNRGPFLDRERELVDTLATIVKGYYERRTSIERLETSTARYRTLLEDVLDTIDIGVFVLDEERTVVWANSAVADYFDLDRDAIIGADKRQLVTEEIAEKAENSDVFEERVLATYDDNAGTQQFECHVTPDEGREERWLTHWSKPITAGLYEGGRVEHYTDITDRKERERELERQRELLRHTEELARTGGWEADVETGEQRWTEGTKAIHDVSEDFDPTVEAGIEFFHPDDRDRIERVYTRCATVGEPYDVELRLVTSSDRVRWVRATGEPVREDGEIVNVRGAIRDITDRKERERELKRSERRYHTLAENFPNGAVLVFDTDLRYQYAHGEIFSTVDSDPGDYEGKRIGEVFDGETLDIKREMYEATLNGESRHREMEFTERVYQVHTIPIRDESGDVYAGIVTTWDITDRKERERELETARKRYQTLIEAAPDPIVVADADTREIIEANAAAAALRKQPCEKLVGRTITALHPEEDADRYRAEFDRRVEREGTVTEFDDGSPPYFVTGDGEEIPISISAGTVSLEDRTVVHGIFRDVSEQKRIEESLKGVNRAARDMLHAETDADIAQTVVNVTTEVLEVSGCATYLYDEQACELAPAAYTDDLEAIFGELPRFSPGEGVAWRVFAEQESAYLDDVRTSDVVYNPGTPIRSELLVPIGDHGVFIVGDTEISAIDDITVEMGETLAATAEARSIGPNEHGNCESGSETPSSRPSASNASSD